MRQFSAYALPIVVTTLLMSGCDKADNTATKPAETKTVTSTTTETKTQSTASAPAVTTIASAVASGQIQVTDNKTNQTVTITPAGKMVADMMKSSVLALAQSGKLGGVSNQKTLACLAGESSGMAYYGDSQKFLNSNFTPEEIQKMDKAFGSPVGMKVLQLNEQQLLRQYAGVEPKNPITLTTAEQQEAKQSIDKATVQKLATTMQQQTSSETPFLLAMTDIANKELERCER